MSIKKSGTIRPLPASKNILLAEPEFPIPTKSRNHHSFLPVGLLKIASWLEDEGYNVDIVRGNKTVHELDSVPDEVWITSLFTYWSQHVVKSSKHYKSFPNEPRIVVGGIYASLMPDHCADETECHVVFTGIHKEAERYHPAYHKLTVNPHPIDYQVIHASRGCNRSCTFCGVHVIEGEGLRSVKSILPLVSNPIQRGLKPTKEELTAEGCNVTRKNLVFYDNNLLANENIEQILDELSALKKERKIGWCESQSGFDGRILLRKPFLVKKLKAAGFRYPKVAWDWGLNQGKSVKKQIGLLVGAGFTNKDISVFMIYNWGIPYSDMEKKRVKCFDWQVQVTDCRYRPLTQTEDIYLSKKNADYYIHEKKGWTDDLVRLFRKNVRRHNICIRHNFRFYIHKFERMMVSKEENRRVVHASSFEEARRIMDELDYEYWDPKIEHKI